MRIHAGDALTITGIPALVVPANRQLELGWGSHVAERVLELAGRAVEPEAFAQHPGDAAQGDAVLTSGAISGSTH